MEGSGAGSVLVTNGSGCGSVRPKNIRILRIRIRCGFGSPTLVNDASQAEVVLGTLVGWTLAAICLRRDGFKMERILS
jgi:hypothetical protein